MSNIVIDEHEYYVGKDVKIAIDAIEKNLAHTISTWISTLEDGRQIINLWEQDFIFTLLSERGGNLSGCYGGNLEVIYKSFREPRIPEFNIKLTLEITPKEEK